MAVSWAGLVLTAGPWYPAGHQECHKTSQTSPFCDCNVAKQKQGQLFLWNFMESCLTEYSQNQEHRPDHKMVRHRPPFATWVIGVSLPIIILPYFTLLPLDKKNFCDTLELPLFSWQHLIQSKTMLSWTFSKIMQHKPPGLQHAPALFHLNAPWLTMVCILSHSNQPITPALTTGVLSVGHS